MKLKTITMADITACSPCYDPAKYADNSWTGNALDVLRHPAVPAEDKLWLVLQSDFIDDVTKRLFVCWCAKEAFKVSKNVDPRSVKAVETAEKFALGQASSKELRQAARDAATHAIDADNAYAATRDAHAAYAAAYAAADAATHAAADAVTHAAYAARTARTAARKNQVKQLIKLLSD